MKSIIQKDLWSITSFLENKEYNFNKKHILTHLPEKFIDEALKVARIGVAVLVRTVFLESIGRYQRLFSISPPSYVAQFSERVPIVKGRLDIKATTATGYAWCVWEKNLLKEPRLKWIEPCRKELEKQTDYLEPLSSSYK